MVEDRTLWATGARRPQVQAERRLVAEWAAARYPDRPKWFNQRLGAGPVSAEEMGLSEEEWRASVGQRRRYADLLVLEGREVLVVEAKIVAEPGVVGQLALYADLVAHTPELVALRTVPVRQVLLCAREDPAVSIMARRAGVRVEIFSPLWVSDYLRLVAARARDGKALDAALRPPTTTGHPPPGGS